MQENWKSILWILFLESCSSISFLIWQIYVVRVLREGQMEPTFIFRTFDEFQELHNKLGILFPLWKLPGYVSENLHVCKRRFLEVENTIHFMFMFVPEIKTLSLKQYNTPKGHSCSQSCERNDKELQSHNDIMPYMQSCFIWRLVVFSSSSPGQTFSQPCATSFFFLPVEPRD